MRQSRLILLASLLVVSFLVAPAQVISGGQARDEDVTYYTGRNGVRLTQDEIEGAYGALESFNGLLTRLKNLDEDAFSHHKRLIGRDNWYVSDDAVKTIRSRDGRLDSRTEKAAFDGWFGEDFRKYMARQFDELHCISTHHLPEALQKWRAILSGLQAHVQKHLTIQKPYDDPETPTDENENEGGGGSSAWSAMIDRLRETSRKMMEDARNEAAQQETAAGPGENFSTDAFGGLSETRIAGTGGGGGGGGSWGGSSASSSVSSSVSTGPRSTLINWIRKVCAKLGLAPGEKIDTAIVIIGKAGSVASPGKINPGQSLIIPQLLLGGARGKKAKAVFLAKRKAAKRAVHKVAGVIKGTLSKHRPPVSLGGSLHKPPFGAGGSLHKPPSSVLTDKVKKGFSTAKKAVGAAKSLIGGLF